jgi:hypothetical protein
MGEEEEEEGKREEDEEGKEGIEIGAEECELLRDFIRKKFYQMTASQQAYVRIPTSLLTLLLYIFIIVILLPLPPSYYRRCNALSCPPSTLSRGENSSRKRCKIARSSDESLTDQGVVVSPPLPIVDQRISYLGYYRQGQLKIVEELLGELEEALAADEEDT